MILNNLINNFNNFLWSYVLIIMLISLGLFFSFKTKFIQIRYIKEMFILLGDGFGDKSESSKHSVSSFQAFCISTASRVGTGNLAGIAMAISVGGPGAIFWMWLIAIVGAASSFIESTLAQLYKVKDEKHFRGGPAYYIEKGLKKPLIGILFSILITITFGLVFNSVQSNTIGIAFNEAFGVSTIWVGLAITMLTAFIICGGIKRVAKVSEIIVPILAILYIAISLFVVIKNIGTLPSVIAMIFKYAFGLKQFLGGTLGGTLLIGIKRGLFSNEAGMGSAPNAAATADVTHPVKQGLIQTLGVFTDTLIICSCTAFIILLSDINIDSSLTGIQLTQRALTSQVGSWGTIFVAICILLFAFSSIVGNYYYGECNIKFITSNKFILLTYRILVVLMVMMGSIMSMDIVWTLADLFMGLMALINLISIALLHKKAIIALNDYVTQKNNGIKDPIFDASKYDEFDDLELWKINAKEDEEIAS